METSLISFASVCIAFDIFITLLKSLKIVQPMFNQITQHKLTFIGIINKTPSERHAILDKASIVIGSKTTMFLICTLLIDVAFNTCINSSYIFLWSIIL